MLAPVVSFVLQLQGKKSNSAHKAKKVEKQRKTAEAVEKEDGVYRSALGKISASVASVDQQLGDE